MYWLGIYMYFPTYEGEEENDYYKSQERVTLGNGEG